MNRIIRRTERPSAGGRKFRSGLSEETGIRTPPRSRRTVTIRSKDSGAGFIRSAATTYLRLSSDFIIATMHYQMAVFEERFSRAVIVAAMVGLLTALIQVSREKHVSSP